MLSDAAKNHVTQWLNSPIDSETKAQIQLLLKQDPTALNDAFASTLSFGTGGIRQLMGVGSNRLNRYTIQIATQGLANYLLKTFEKHTPLTVFISYDCRENSKEFALETACVLAGNKIGVYLTKDLRPTAFVSFGVQQKKCQAGVMITASHNPKEYNGYKVYWQTGGQVVFPHDVGIVEEVKKITDFGEIKIASPTSPLIEWVGKEFDTEYLEAIKKLQLDPKTNQKVGNALKITYTPLHGTGITLLPQALHDWGFSNVNLVDAQIIPNGHFPTIQSPNPENLATLSMGLKQMQDLRSDLLIATDPDADRMALATLYRDEPYVFNGNQIAVMCLEYLCQTLQRQNKLSTKLAAVTTVVSTALFAKICFYYNIHYGEVLTGFKYIGALIDEWRTNQLYTFLFGAEESYGYLYGTHSLDKDAVIAGCLVAEIALLMKIEGLSLVDFLIQIYKKYGFFLERQHVIDFPVGESGMQQIKLAMQKLRQTPPLQLANKKVRTIEDYKEGIKNLPPSDMLVFHLEDNSKLVVRPSGTEPKLKIYASFTLPSFSSLEKDTKQSEDHLQKLFHALTILF